MVAKISHGMSLYGALAYNYDKVAAGAGGGLFRWGHTSGIALF